MSRQSMPADDFSASLALRRLLAFAGVGAAIAGVHLLFDIGFPCPLQTITGVQCPFCGGTRAAAALIRADLGAAWSHNALVVVAAPLLAALGLAWTVEICGGAKLRPPRVLRPLNQTRIYWTVGIIAGLFMLVRNLI